VFVKIAVDSDDELPCIKFSCSSVPSEQKNREDTASTNITKVSSGICRGPMATEPSDLMTCAGDVVVVDSDSSDSDSLKDCMFKYSRSLRERCNASTVLSSADRASPSVDSCDLQLDVQSARASVTDDQSCCNSLTDNSPAGWKSYEDSEDVASQQLSQTSASDVNSQSSSVQSVDNKRRKRPQKADDPEVVVLIAVVISINYFIRIDRFMSYDDYCLKYLSVLDSYR